MDWGDPDPTEAALLEIPETQSVLLREVHLKCADELCVYARSVIPRHTLEGPHQHLGELGDKPLGEYLFASPSLQRSQVEWTGLTPQSSLYQKALPQGSANGGTIWGRRSLFHIDNRPLLVSEFFLPVLFGAS